MCLGVDFFGFILFWGCCTFWICRFVSLPTFKKLPDTISLISLSAPFCFYLFSEYVEKNVRFLMVVLQAPGALFISALVNFPSVVQIVWISLSCPKFTDSYLLSFLLYDYFVVAVIVCFMYTISMWFFFITLTSLTSFFFFFHRFLENL